MSGNPFLKSAKMKVRRGKSQRQLAKDATAALVRRTAKPGRRSYNLTQPPLSLNNVYENRSDGGRRVSKRYKDWLTSAGWEIRSQNPEAIAGPFAVAIEVGHRQSGADLDNLAKPIIDLMVEMGCVPDDRNAPQILLLRTERPDVRITVWTIGHGPDLQQFSIAAALADARTAHEITGAPV